MATQIVGSVDRKVTIGALGGALGVFLVWLLSAIFGIIIPAEPAMAVQTMIIFMLQWAVPNVKPPSESESHGDA